VKLNYIWMWLRFLE